MTEQEPDGTDRMGLWEYLVVLRRRWGLVVGGLIVVMLLALGYSLWVTPEYVTTADVLVEPSGADAASGSTEVSSEEVATQAQVVTSRPVARLVQQRLSLARLPDLDELVTVQAVGTARILRLTVRDTDPGRAAKTANTVATAYLQHRQQDSINRYQQASSRLAQEQADTEDRLREVDALLVAGKDNGGSPSLNAERRALLTDLAQINTQLDALGDSLTTAAAGGELLGKADVPQEPASPRTALNIALAGVFGLLFGAAAALLRERFDDGVHDETEVRRALGDAPLLGRVPRWPDQSHRERLVTLIKPLAPASEEYQRLGVNVRFMLAPGRQDGSPGAVVLTTSGQDGEGKTVTSCNLAVAAARMGLAVVLVDADLRRAAVSPRFGLGDPPGLSDLLMGEGAHEAYLVDVGVDRLQILPAGTIPPNPVALLASIRMRLLLSELAQSADLVIVDSPPALMGADTLELVNHADMVMVVAREGVTRRRQLISVMESLRHVTACSVGVVYNGVGDGVRSTHAYTSRPRRTHTSVLDGPAHDQTGRHIGAASPVTARDGRPVVPSARRAGRTRAETV